MTLTPLRAYALSMSGPALIAPPILSLCLTCGLSFAQTVHTGRRRLYCSPECKVARQAQRQKARRRERPPRMCEGCGAPVEGHGLKRFCSQECLRRAKEGGKPKKPVRLPATKLSACSGGCGKRIQVRVDREDLPTCRVCRPARLKASPGICMLCEEPYVPKKAARPDQRWCSKSCAQAWRNGARPPYRRNVVTGMPLKVQRSRIRSQRKRETWDGVTDAQIFERDRWRCGICHTRIGKKFRYPHPRSASIDHIVPLSQGGDDTAANKRATHLGCNRRRMNRGGGEQLALIG